jgi:hypothetical protein
MLEISGSVIKHSINKREKRSGILSILKKYDNALRSETLSKKERR